MKTRSLLLAATCISVASALSAQQPGVTLPPAETAVTAAPAVPVPVAPAGPRVRADIQPVSFSAATDEPMAMRRRATTITLSTVALVLLVVVVVLLVT